MNIDLDALRPTGKWMIIDCVQSAGIDVTAWSFRRSDRQPVALPQSNGGYCYEWSFRSADNNTLVLCVWWEGLRIDPQGRVCFSENLRAYADTLSQQLEKEPRNRNRTVKDPRITRARHFSTTIQLAHMNRNPVRVVIVSGPVRELGVDGADHDRATGRQLDDQPWFVEAFDDKSGAFSLVRGGHDSPGQVSGSSGLDEPSNTLETDVKSDVPVVDQFATEERKDSYVYNGIQRHRDPNIRKRVLKRSGGVCELTGVPGFPMENGGVYLETHHIVPLSEGGPDAVENVIALTADAHRQAHYAVGRNEMRARCLEIVACRIKQFAVLG